MYNIVITLAQVSRSFNFGSGERISSGHFFSSCGTTSLVALWPQSSRSSGACTHGTCKLTVSWYPSARNAPPVKLCSRGLHLATLTRGAAQVREVSSLHVSPLEVEWITKRVKLNYACAPVHVSYPSGRGRFLLEADGNKHLSAVTSVAVAFRLSRKFVQFLIFRHMHAYNCGSLLKSWQSQ